MEGPKCEHTNIGGRIVKKLKGQSWTYHILQPIPIMVGVASPIAMNSPFILQRLPNFQHTMRVHREAWSNHSRDEGRPFFCFKLHAMWFTQSFNYHMVSLMYRTSIRLCRNQEILALISLKRIYLKFKWKIGFSLCSPYRFLDFYSL